MRGREAEDGSSIVVRPSRGGTQIGGDHGQEPFLFKITAYQRPGRGGHPREAAAKLQDQLFGIDSA